MTVLEYCAKHNMISYLEKIKENAQFHEIVDFLSRSSIFYALTVSPNVCTSFIEQFWKTATFKTVNNISQIHAKVAGKPVVIPEASIRGDLLFNDVDGIDYQTNKAIFENLALMGYEGDLIKLTFQKALFSPQWKFLIHIIIHCLSSKSASLDQFPTRKFTPLCPSMLTQEAVAEGEDLGTPTESQLTPSPTQPSAGVQPPLTESSSDHDSSQDPRVDLEGTSRSGGDHVNLPHNNPLSGGHTSDRAEGSLNPEALYALCTNLSNRVLALETVKDAQAKEILTLKAKIKKLEKRYEDLEYMDIEEALNEGRQSTVSTARPDVSTARPYVSTTRPDDDTARQELSTARQELSTVGPTTTPTTSTIFDDEEMTLADNLIKLKDDKAKGVAFKDSDSTDRPTRSILTLKPLLTIDPKEKGKDEKIARQLEVELQAEVKRERQREEQASIDYIANLYDEVQARIDVDHELAVRWTHEEQDKYTVDERAKLLAEYFKRRKKQLAEERVEQELIADFVPIRSEEDERMIRDMNKKAEEERSDKERRYPLTIRTLERMMSLRLIAESANDAAYDLLRFIQMQTDKSEGHDRGEKDL
nr:hypothetical protein [Tanacetum cinerariifolium]